ncbi:MAG: hypothetical protein HOW73_10230 [Polyangiaceae bacterium]|nr:hypothetical protein [Polyangiaceae bacterium]
MATQKRPLRIQDASLRDAAGRLESFTTMVNRRVDEMRAAEDRAEKTLALFEAEVAAKLVESAVYEVSLRLLPHGVEFDPARQLSLRLGRFRRELASFEVSYGPLPRA